MSVPLITVEKSQSHDGGGRYAVNVDGVRFDVGVRDADAQRLAPGIAVDALVRESFRFLLEREPLESILPAFDLPVIGRYFPGYEAEIGRRMRRA